MGMNKDIAYVKFIVHRWLFDKQSLQVFREDLEQEGYLALLQSQGKYDASYGQDEDLWRYHQIHNAIRKYIDRKEVRHFKKPETDHESSYWNLNDPVMLEDLEVNDEREVQRNQLLELTIGIQFSDRHQEILKLLMEDKSMALVGKALGITQQRVHQSYVEIVSIIKEANDIE